MSGDRIFLLVFGALTVLGRFPGVVWPGPFARFAARWWPPDRVPAWTKPFGVLLLGAGALGLCLAWPLRSVQAIVAAALSATLVGVGLGLLMGLLALVVVSSVVFLVLDDIIRKVGKVRIPSRAAWARLSVMEVCCERECFLCGGDQVGKRCAAGGLEG